MGRLVGVELTRLRSRAATRVVAALLLLIALAGGVGSWLQASPPDATELAQAQQQYEADLAYWEENADRDHQQCLEDEEREREVSGGDIDFGCAVILDEPQLEWYLPGWISPFESLLTDAVFGQAVTLGAFLLLLGATFLAADFGSGAIGTWLTFAPRRGSVLTAKLLAVALGAAVLAALSILLTWALSWAAYRLRDLPTLLPDGAGEDLLWMSVRVWAVAVGAALAGVALAAVLRSTAAVIAVAAGYLLVVETSLGSVFTGLRQWGLTTNLAGFVNGSFEIWRLECTVDSFGESCSSVPVALDPDQFSIVIGAALVLVVLAGFVAFRRRDVA